MQDKAGYDSFLTVLLGALCVLILLTLVARALLAPISAPTSPHMIQASTAGEGMGGMTGGAGR